MYQGGDSPFRGSDGILRISKVLEVMKTCISYGVTSVDLSPPLVEAFQRLRAEADTEIVGLGALQEWSCRSFTIDGVPLENYSEEIKATISSKLSQGDLEHLGRSPFRSLLIPRRESQPLTSSQIDSVEMKIEFFKNRLELYKKLNVKLVQFGGGTADWLGAIGRTDLLETLSRLIRNSGFVPVLIAHWTSMVITISEKELEVAGYIVPLNRLWGLLTLPDALSAIKKTERPVIAMKTLAQGALANDLQEAFTFIFKEAGATAALVGVSSQNEARQTFSTIAEVLGTYNT
jgi:hypothetical protein